MTGVVGQEDSGDGLFSFPTFVRTNLHHLINEYARWHGSGVVEALTGRLKLDS